MKLKLRGKFLLPTIVLVIACLVVMGYLSYHFAGDALTNAVEEQIVQRTNALETQVSAWLSERRREVKNWSTTKLYNDALQDGFVAKAARKTASQTMTDLKNEYNSLESLNLADKAGEVVASSDENNIGSSISDRDYFKEAMKGEMAISPVLISWTTGVPIFTIAAPVETDQQVVGVFYATVDLASFNSKFIDPMKIGENGYAFMFDKQGLMIAYPPDPEKILDMDMSQLPFGRQMIAKVNGMLRYHLNDVQRITAFRRNEETGWTVCMAALTDEVFAPAARIGYINMVLTIVMTVIIGLAMTLLVSQLVSKPLRKVVKVIQNLSRGNLQERAQIDTHDELGQLSVAVNEFIDNLSGFTKVLGEIGQGDLSKDVPPFSEEDEIGPAAQAMLDNLRDIVSRVERTSANIANGSAQVSDSSQALSQGATQQAASIEEITSSMTELGGQTNTNAENAAQANTLAASARNSAQKGNKQMEEMVGAMQDISDSSKEIAKIIKAIDDIAFQTNLLALNAAVEAARAGKHGKGFAVVAQEVRNLAGRSAKAAQETAELIEGAVNNVETGTNILNRTAGALSEIMESSTKVTDLVAEIAAASNEQAQGITQINQGLSQVEQVTQQNTASAEETASASVELSTQAASMRKLLQRFTLKTEQEDTGEDQSVEDDEFHPGKIAKAVNPGLAWDDAESEDEPEIMSPEDLISLDDDDFNKF